MDSKSGKCVIVAVTALLLVPSVSASQAGYIGLYFDFGGTVCSLTEEPNGFVPMYAIHQATAGAGAVQFGVEASNPSGFVHLGETSPYATIIGSVWVHDEGQGGSIAYGACVGSPNLVKTVNVLTLGINPMCTTITVIPDPASLTGTIEVVDCSNNKLIGAGGRVIVNSDGSCLGLCQIEPAVEKSTWGGVKALYQ